MTTAITRTAMVLFALALPICANADIGAAMDAYKNKEFDKAFEQFQQLAQLGNAQAQYALGVMYVRGEGTSPNNLLAYGWLKLAADNGQAKAKALVPKLRADMIDESIGAAERLVSRFAASALNERLMPKILQNCEYQGMTRPKAKKMVAPIYPRGAQKAGVEGSVLVELTVAADGTVRDTRVVRAFPIDVFEPEVLRVTPKWLFEAPMRDGTPTMVVVTYWFVFTMDKKAISIADKRWFTDIKQKAEAGEPAAQYVYAMILSGDPEFQEPWGNVLPWIERSAQAGFASAQYQLGESLLTGRGCEPDSDKAIQWITIAAQQDQPEAEVSLARLLLKAGPSYDAQKALFWLNRAAEQGGVRANKYLAALLASSTEERIRDPVRALDLIAKVDRGDAKEPTTIEIRAAALANSGDFKAAVKSQSLAIDRAAILNWDVSPMKVRLEAYKNSQPWYGELIPF